MAALSCYQPCRSHLAQPARCLDEDDFELSTLTIRRRQFIQRCHDTRTGRNRDLIPEVSVKKTREELTKHAAQNAQLTRRLNVESGWSKVEEVRKKFEGAATASYSRSFESPPRRRLADSLFASFKLPRKKDMSTPRSLVPQQKRKSAVELLAESKAFYVKSETVLDRKQEHPLRVSSGLSQAIAAGGCHLVSSGALGNDACCNPYATTRVIDVRRAAVGAVGVSGGVGGPGGGAGGGLQSTLRRLLEHSDSRENVYPPPYVSQKNFSDARRLKDSYPEREISRSLHTSGTFSGTSSSGTSGSKQKSDDKNRPLSFGDTRVFFPDSFVIPRQRPTEVVIKNTYSIPAAASPQPGGVLGGVPGGVLGAISPPAEYAHSAHRYVRSNSHSQPSAREDDCSNINSHKSLPDLHAQAHAYPERVNVVVGPESVGRSPRRRRHSAHHRTASCSSKGTRSNHSSLMSSCDAFSEHPSPEENYQSYNSRCGSSFARDSGGSSGHYTQRSAPPHAHHDRTRGYSYHTNSGSTLEQCYVSAPPQFQDGAPSPSPPAHYPPPAPPAPPPHTLARVGIHFQASAPPPQFQDEPLYDYNDYDCAYKTPLKCITGGRKEYTREYSRYHEPSTELVSQQPQQQEPRPRRLDDLDYGGADGRQAQSPLGSFKRQRCLRYKQHKQHKQRRPRLVLRSKSDVSDRYLRSDGRSSSSAPCEGSPPPSPSAESLRLHRFFDYLGMESRQYDAVVRDGDDDSPVFFSSASTVDSNRVAAAADYTVQGPGVQKQIYRNAEPPSVVERNARIIKWLCQCRKALIQPPQ